MTEEKVIHPPASLQHEAAERFCNGCNCSQSVLSVFAARYGVDEKLAMRIATGLGGGVGRMGGNCGTLTGAALVIGLELGPTKPGDTLAKEATYATTRWLQEQFIQRHGSQICRELLNKDLSKDLEYQQAREEGLFKTRCPNYVETVVGLLDEWLEKMSAMKKKVLTMLELQDAMNCKVNPDWREAGYAWYRAIWTECAEMLDHYGWKWWKHQEPDMQQVHLEIIDIWHFALSDLILHSESLEAAADLAMQGLSQQSNPIDLHESIEQLAAASIQTRSADIAHFNTLMRSADLGFDELFKTYVGKNVLNFFRQDHGYKDGSYIKIWQGREDNEHLAEILSQLDADSQSFSDDVYRQLEAAYPTNPE